VHIDLNSYDYEMNKYSLQMLISSKYYSDQQFFTTISLLSDKYGLGIDALKISDEISDPQDNNGNQVVN
jgi:hypothetical protein